MNLDKVAGQAMPISRGGKGTAIIIAGLIPARSTAPGPMSITCCCPPGVTEPSQYKTRHGGGLLLMDERRGVPPRSMARRPNLCGDANPRKRLARAALSPPPCQTALEFMVIGIARGFDSKKAYS
jgi:hypothetical protein